MYAPTPTTTLTRPLSWEVVILVHLTHVYLAFKAFVDEKMRLLATDSQYHKTHEQIKAEFEIIQKAQQDPRFFAPIYEKYYDSIFIYVSKRVDDYETTAEITSMVFYKCLKNLEKFKFQGVPFSAWLFKIAINEINQFFRKQKASQRVVSLTDKHISVLFDEIETATHLDPHAIITQLLEQLSASEIQFLELRFFEGRSFKEMAYLLGLTEVNAKVKTYRILKKLKKIAVEIDV